jgi:hypothetical protein
MTVKDAQCRAARNLPTKFADDFATKSADNSHDVGPGGAAGYFP